ncbi:MAG: hypothetical protein ACHQRL_03905, partial [Gemmatimonadales bacterium]
PGGDSVSPPLAAAISGYIDLRWRLNPVEATFHGVYEFDGQFASYDAESVREHLAALVSFESAIEEAGADTVAEEIDRTAVLHSLRHEILLLQRERQFVRNPSYHLWHAVNGIFLLLAHRLRIVRGELSIELVHSVERRLHGIEPPTQVDIAADRRG